MSMRWRKLGLVYVATGETDWAKTHAFVPTAIRLPSGGVRVYAAFLDERQVGRIGFVDVDAENPRRILQVSKRPALDIGEPGTFDDHGVTPLSVLDCQGKRYLYYAGWQLGVQVRYYLFTGLAVSDDGGTTFRRYARVPLLDRSDDELFARTGAYVMADGPVWKMWYVGGSAWIDVQGKQCPTYAMKYLESGDGVRWGPKGAPCLDPADDDEIGFGRPCVLREKGLYKMWYSIRSKSKGYRLGYGESHDGRQWLRKDGEVGIGVSERGWDSEMVCFASLVTANNRTYLFYNGSHCGETGFGVAVLDA